jgi:choline-sulfatase
LKIVAGKWDEQKLTKSILLSQARRLFVREATKEGTPTRWNHDEEPGEDVLWYRGQGSYNEWAFKYLP